MSLAFIEVTDWKDCVSSASGDPTALLNLFSWLKNIYTAFDALVDSFGERVYKIEEVRE